MKILLVNPPVYDFTAYDFWLKPLGMLTVAGFLRNQTNFELFDFLDRSRPDLPKGFRNNSDKWGRGPYFRQRTERPGELKGIPRYYHRFGIKRDVFRKFLSDRSDFDFVMIQTTMTYWYQGIKEVIEDIRRLQPKSRIILGGTYVTLCPGHAENLGADLCVRGTKLNPLWDFTGLQEDWSQPALWEVYDKPDNAAIKISDGCPFRCTYCSVPQTYGSFTPRDRDRAIRELKLILSKGVRNIAFYDDALLCRPDDALVPFLKYITDNRIDINLHTPNALNARLINPQIAELMVKAGVKTFNLGFESSCYTWQKKTGGKVYAGEFERAVNDLITAGARGENITAYQILGHPMADLQGLEKSIRLVNSLGIRGMLADFSPIPGTKDGRMAEKWVDMKNPLMQNKTAYPIISLGCERVNQLKELQNRLNQTIYR